MSDISKKHPELKVQKRSALNTTYLGFNFRDKFAGNRDVRRAIAHAIDRDAIIKYILKGTATPAKTLLTPNDPFINRTISQKNYDPKKAEQILDKAGFKDPDGKGPKPRFKMTYKTTTNTTRINIAKAIANQLKKVGIKVDVVSLEWGKFKADVEKGQVQMWSLSWVGFKDPDIYRYAFATRKFSAERTEPWLVYQ